MEPRRVDIIKPYGPVAREGVFEDTFNDLTRTDAKKSNFVYDQAAGAILPPNKAKDLPKFVADNGLVTVTTTAYEKVKEVRAVLTEEDKGRKFTIRFSHRGKARLTVKDEAGNVHLEKEYSSAEEAVQTEEVKLKKKSGSVLVAVLELASLDGVTPAENRIFEVSYGRAEFEYGVVQALPVSFGTTVHSVRLFYTGTGVVFQVSTDGGTKWQKIEPGREVMLDEPGTEILVKVLLLIDPATVLYDYRIDINPYHDMSFTGKFLEPEIGLIYFGGRWYEPGIGRWVTVDPAEDGENWYGYCANDPVNNFDPDGRLSLRGWGTLFGGLGYGFKTYAPKNALDIAVSIAVGTAMALGMEVLAPALPAAAPTILGAIKIIGSAMMIPFAVDMANDLTYLVKNFSYVFFAHNPAEAKIRQYGITISKVTMNLVAMIATKIGLNAIIKSGIFAKIGYRLNKLTGEEYVHVTPNKFVNKIHKEGLDPSVTGGKTYITKLKYVEGKSRAELEKILYNKSLQPNKIGYFSRKGYSIVLLPNGASPINYRGITTRPNGVPQWTYEGPVINNPTFLWGGY